MASKIAISRNPFHFGPLALDEAFADREAELRELKGDVLNGQDVVIFAPRRYGKSSLVWKAMQELVGEGVLIAYVNLLLTPTKERLAEKLAAAIYENISSAAERAREKALAPFRGLRIEPTITIDPGDGSFGFSFAAGRQQADVDATLERLLALPAELGAARERRVAVIFDEFQEVVMIDPGLPRLMRTIFEQQPEVGHTYLGSRRHMMERIFNDENEPFWRSAKQMELAAIEPAEFRDFIRASFAATNKGIDAEIVDAVLRITHGHPYGTQELCYFLWEATPFDATAGGADLERALDGVMRSEHAHLSDQWESAAAGQRTVLTALALEPGHPLRNEYRARHGLPSIPTIQSALRALTRRELVLRERDGAYRIAEPFLAEWIAANVVERTPRVQEPGWSATSPTGAV
jgi:hypothetical protein